MYTFLLFMTFLLVVEIEASMIQRGPRRRPDLPQRAGQGFFMNHKYVSDESLWSIFGQHAAITPPSTSLDTFQHDTMHHGYQTQTKYESFRHRCCDDYSAKCRACHSGQTISEFCEMHPFVIGCEGESIVLHENEVCYEYCPRGTQINYPDKCAFDLVCAPFSVELLDGGGCGLQAYTCQRKKHFESETVLQHQNDIADHMMTHYVLGDDWIDDEMQILMEEMSICEQIEYKVKLDPSKCDLQHRYLYKKKGCCKEGQLPDSPLVYIIIGAVGCCCFMTCAAAGGCAEMQRRKANRLERRMRRLIDVNKDMDVMTSFWERKNENHRLQLQRQLRYNELHAVLHEKSPLLYNEIL